MCVYICICTHVLYICMCVSIWVVCVSVCCVYMHVSKATNFDVYVHMLTGGSNKQRECG